MVVHSHEQRFPVCIMDRVTPVARDAVARAQDAIKLLGVDVQQFAECLALVAHQSTSGLQIAQLG